jgi:hypothetical protein
VYGVLVEASRVTGRLELVGGDVEVAADSCEDVADRASGPSRRTKTVLVRLSSSTRSSATVMRRRGIFRRRRPPRFVIRVGSTRF